MNLASSARMRSSSLIVLQLGCGGVPIEPNGNIQLWVRIDKLPAVGRSGYSALEELCQMPAGGHYGRL
jgi:hypothetical protein